MAVKAAFEAQEARVLRKLRAASTRKGTRHWDYGADFDPAKEKKAIDPAKVFPLEAETEAFTAAAFPPIENIYQSFGAGTGNALGVAFNLRDPAVAADILARSNRLARATETTWNKVQEAIIDGEAEGETIDGIQKRIGRVFTQAKGYRSRVIARTETVGAMNAGSYRAADQSGVVEKKVWLAAVDHRTRSTHVTADGQAVAMKKKFAVGASRMDHPGDPAGGAKEVVNCRCSMIFKRTAADAPDVALADIEPAEVEDVFDPDLWAPAPVGTPEKVAQIKAEAASLRRRTRKDAYPLDDVGSISANTRREADIRALGAQVREEAVHRAGEVKLDQEAIDALAQEIRDLRSASFKLSPRDFGHGVDPSTGVEFPNQIKEGASRIDAYKKARAAAEKQAKVLKEKRARLQAAPNEARGRAALEVLQELREMGTDVKKIAFETGSSAPGKKAVQEMSEWFPAEWWANSDAAMPIQVKVGRGGFYSHLTTERRQGVTRYVSRLQTDDGHTPGDLRTTTVHELGHRMESTQEDVTRLEFRFWRRRTEDGTASGGIKKYKYNRYRGTNTEWVNDDQFGDDYMGKSYLSRHGIDPKNGAYEAADLDKIEAGTNRPTSWEVLSMGMEELAFNRHQSWDLDPDYIDFILGVLAGV